MRLWYRSFMRIEQISSATAETPGFISESQLLTKIPVCRRTLNSWRQKKLIPFIRLPGTRRLLYDFESVRAALLRMECDANQ
jgi:hypothetical protein